MRNTGLGGGGGASAYAALDTGSSDDLYVVCAYNVCLH